MFNGTENLPGDYFTYLQQIGATDLNGTTSFDRTNYFQTVPTGALERVLFMESDRMGHLLGAVTQGVLDNQRGVVQNEKRQGDNRPGGLVFYKVLETLFPEGHPYQHSTIGSMADLDAASLATVAQLVPRQIWAEQCRAGAGRRHRCGERAAAGREIFRIDRARPGQQCRPGGDPDAARATVGGDEGQCRNHDRVALLADPRPARRAAGRAGCRRSGARRPREFAARRSAGAQREDSDPGVGRPLCLPAGRHLHCFGDGQARHRPGGSGKEARRACRRLHRQGPIGGRGAPRVGYRGRGPDPRARASGRLWRQGGHAGRRANLCRRQRMVCEKSCNLRFGNSQPTFAVRWANG